VRGPRELLRNFHVMISNNNLLSGELNISEGIKHKHTNCILLFQRDYKLSVQLSNVLPILHMSP